MYLRMSLCRFSEYLEFEGTLNFPELIANVDSPNGREKKQSLYNKHPRAWKKIVKLKCVIFFYDRYILTSNLENLPKYLIY